MSPGTEPTLTRRRFSPELLVVLALFLAALAVRVYRLQSIPFGLIHDEAFNGLDVLDILAGNHPIFFERNLGREPIFIYLQAVSVALLGPSPFALRLVSALAGALTAPTLYWMVREAFRPAVESRWLATWTALFLAFSYWHLSFSRLGLRAILLPLFATIAFALFWRAWRRLEENGSFPWADLALCGGLTGAGLYTYIAARFVPVLIVLVVVAGTILRWRVPGFRERAVAALAVIGGTALLIFAPLGAYFIGHPQFFFGRAADVSILNPAYNDGRPLAALIHSAMMNASMFGFTGDPNAIHNPAGRPVFDILLAAWLLLGIVVAVIRWRSLRYFFALAWAFIFALPAVLTADALPHSLRAIGMLPAVCLLAVLGMAAAAGWLARLSHTERPWTQSLAAWLPLPFLLFSGFTALQDYYSAWDRNQNLYTLYEAHFFDALQKLFAQEQGQEGVWIMPVAPGFYATSNIDFLLRSTSQGRIDYGAVPASESIASARLTALTQGHTQAHLVEWQNPGLFWDGSYANADPKHLLQFLLSKYGERVRTTTGQALGYSTYSVPSDPMYQVTTITAPADTIFHGEVQLTGVGYGRTASSSDPPAVAEGQVVPSGQSMWVVLRWEAQAPIDRDLTVSLRLEDAAGHLAGQVDDLLVGDRYPFERTWEKGEGASTYHILPLLPGIPPGQYRLRLSVYDPKTMLPLTIRRPDGSTGPVTADVATVEVAAPVAQATPAAMTTMPLGTELGPDLRLYGYDLPSRTVDTGATLPLTLYWQGEGAWDADRAVMVKLEGRSGEVIAESDALLRATNAGVPGWPEEAPVRTWLDLKIPPSVPAGMYDLVISQGGARPLRISLGAVEVLARPHSFVAPAMQHDLDLNVGDASRLSGYDLSTTTVKPGDELTVTLYWQALNRTKRPYTVFVHLLGEGDQAWAQQDNAPVGGTRPTTGWVEDEYLADPYRLVLKPDVPPGVYRVEVGMYDAETGARLSISGREMAQGDRFLLPTTIEVGR